MVSISLPFLFPLFISVVHARLANGPHRPRARILRPFLAQPTATSIPAALDGLVSPVLAPTLFKQPNMTILIPYATICANPMPSNSSSPLGTGPGASIFTSTSPTSSTATSTSNTLLTIGPNSCTTLFTPTATAICSTILRGMGQPPINVTDCNQWVTFSTEMAVGCAAVTAPSVVAITEPQTYYLAAWQDIAAGGVPVDVVAKACSAGGEDKREDQTEGGNCETAREVWALVEFTRIVNVVRTVLYTGVVDGPATLILGSGAFTTSISGLGSQNVTIDSTITSTFTTLVPSISKSVIEPSPTALSETVKTSVVTVTYTVYDAGQSAVVQTSTATRVSTVTARGPPGE